MSCSCKRLGCPCRRDDCANGWVPDPNEPERVTGCLTCRPGWVPAEQRLAQKAAEREADTERRRVEGLAAAAVDEDRQRQMFGDPEDAQGRWPELGPQGG